MELQEVNTEKIKNKNKGNVLYERKQNNNVFSIKTLKVFRIYKIKQNRLNTLISNLSNKSF